MLGTEIQELRNDLKPAAVWIHIREAKQLDFSSASEVFYQICAGTSMLPDMPSLGLRGAYEHSYTSATWCKTTGEVLIHERTVFFLNVFLLAGLY